MTTLYKRGTNTINYNKEKLLQKMNVFEFLQTGTKSK